MNIYLFSSAFSRTSGGIPNTAYYMHEFFAESGNVVHSFSVSENEKSIASEVFCVSGSGIKKFISNSKRYVSEIRKVPNENIAISLSWRYAIVPYMMHIITKTPYVVMCHGNDVLPYSKGLRNYFEKILRKKVLRKSALICANSAFTKNLVCEIIPDASVDIIHPCSGEPVNKQKSSLTDENFILSIGRIEERKGCQYIVDALAEIHDQFPDLKYYIAGDGPYKKELEEHINNKRLQDSCVFLGRVTEDEKNKLLDNCRLLVMPSFLNRKYMSVEGFGIVYIEANAHGKPVVGTRSGGIPDAIIEGKTGFLVDEKNSKQLSMIMTEILTGQVTISEDACYDWANQHYYKNLLGKYLAAFERVLS